MSPFHAFIHCRPCGPIGSREATIGEQYWEVLEVGSLDLPAFPVSFEELAGVLEGLPRLFLEPDGSFVWVKDMEERPCQLDGSLVDDGRHLLTVELKGQCDRATLDQLLTALGWPGQPLIFQLPRYGIYVSEPAFRHRFVAD